MFNVLLHVVCCASCLITACFYMILHLFEPCMIFHVFFNNECIVKVCFFTQRMFICMFFACLCGSLKGCWILFLNSNVENNQTQKDSDKHADSLRL